MADAHSVSDGFIHRECLKAKHLSILLLFALVIIWQCTIDKKPINCHLIDSSVFLISGGSGDKLMLALGVTPGGIIRDCRPGLDMGYLQKSENIHCKKMFSSLKLHISP